MLHFLPGGFYAVFSFLGQHRIILSADAVSEGCQLLSKKRSQYFVYWQAFLQSRWQLVAVGAQLMPLGGNCAVLP